MHFPYHWRVFKTVSWISFLGSSAIVGILYAASILFLRYSGRGSAGKFIFLGAVAVLFSLFVSSFIEWIWKEKLVKKYPLLLKSDPDKLVYCLPSANTNTSDICCGAVEWKVRPEKVTFGQLSASLGSFSDSEWCTPIIKPFKEFKNNFQVSIDLFYGLEKGVQPEALLIYYKDDAGIRKHVERASEEALFEAVREVFFFKNGVCLKEQAFSGSVEGVLEAHFFDIFPKKIMKNGQTHIGYNSLGVKIYCP